MAYEMGEHGVDDDAAAAALAGGGVAADADGAEPESLASLICAEIRHEGAQDEVEAAEEVGAARVKS